MPPSSGDEPPQPSVLLGPLPAFVTTTLRQTVPPPSGAPTRREYTHYTSESNVSAIKDRDETGALHLVAFDLYETSGAKATLTAADDAALFHMCTGGQGRHFYTWTDSGTPLKPALDFEFEPDKQKHSEAWLKLFPQWDTSRPVTYELFVAVCIDLIIDFFRVSLDIAISPANLAVSDSSKATKFSLHIIVLGYKLATNLECKAFYGFLRWIDARISRAPPIADKSIGDTNRKLRCLWSSKLSEPGRIIVPISALDFGTVTTTTPGVDLLDFHPHGLVEFFGSRADPLSMEVFLAHTWTVVPATALSIPAVTERAAQIAVEPNAKASGGRHSARTAIGQRRTSTSLDALPIISLFDTTLKDTFREVRIDETKQRPRDQYASMNARMDATCPKCNEKHTDKFLVTMSRLGKLRIRHPRSGQCTWDLEVNAEALTTYVSNFKTTAKSLTGAEAAQVKEVARACNVFNIGNNWEGTPPPGRPRVFIAEQPHGMFAAFMESGDGNTVLYHLTQIPENPVDYAMAYSLHGGWWFRIDPADTRLPASDEDETTEPQATAEDAPQIRLEGDDNSSLDDDDSDMPPSPPPFEAQPDDMMEDDGDVPEPDAHHGDDDGDDPRQQQQPPRKRHRSSPAQPRAVDPTMSVVRDGPAPANDEELIATNSVVREMGKKVWETGPDAVMKSMLIATSLGYPHIIVQTQDPSNKLYEITTCEDTLGNAKETLKIIRGNVGETVEFSHVINQRCRVGFAVQLTNSIATLPDAAVRKSFGEAAAKGRDLKLIAQAIVERHIVPFLQNTGLAPGASAEDFSTAHANVDDATRFYTLSTSLYIEGFDEIAAFGALVKGTL